MGSGVGSGVESGVESGVGSGVGSAVRRVNINTANNKHNQNTRMRTF